MRLPERSNPWTAAAIIALSALVAVGVLAIRTRPTWDAFGPASLFVGALFLVALIGFALLPFGSPGIRVTKPETDRALAARYAAFRRPLRPFALVVGIGFLVYAAYLGWRIYAHAA